ncbi:helix-turn-helix domain-containing protein [Haloarcula sp. H-GB5]
MRPKIEPYPEAIYCLEQESNSPVTTKRIAEAIGVQPPIVSRMPDTLEPYELIDREKYTGTRLTEGGEPVTLDDGTKQSLPDSITDAIRVHPAGTKTDERRGVA